MVTPRDEDFAKPSEELQHFTNRDAEQAAFRRILDAPGTDPIPILMFHGVGGSGKSWLLKRLRQQTNRLPTAHIDLDPRFGGQALLTDPSRVLGEIRRQFGATIRCPRFDIAYTWLRFKEGQQDEPNFRGSRFLGSAWEFVVEAGDAAASDIPGASLVAWVVNKVTSPVRAWLNESGVGDRLATKLGQEDFVRLKHQLPGEIYPQLHRRLITDLRENLPDQHGRACRAVVFIDTVEALGSHRDSPERLFDAQQWLRDLYDPKSGLLIVLAGRDRLTWDRDHDSPFAEANALEQLPVGGLSEADARDYLGQCSITDPRLQQAILQACEDTETGGEPSAGGAQGYHAFSLGLCADTCWVLRQRGVAIDPATFEMTASDTRTLATRFLRSLGGDGAYAEWLKRLALVTRFDEAAARACFSSAPGAEQDFAWRSLAGYSFVGHAEDSGWLMLHARMREALDAIEQTDNEVHWREGHKWWRNHWSGRAESETDHFSAAAWYHDWQIDAAAARREWNVQAESARASRRMADHYALLSWWEPCGLMGLLTDAESRLEAVAALHGWGLEYWSASLGDRATNLRRAIDCFDSVLLVYSEYDFPQNWATTQNGRGVAYAALPSGDRAANLRRAIDCYDAALRVYTEADFSQDWAMTQNNLGTAYADLPSGDRDANLRRAIGCFDAALRVYAEADFPQAWATTQNNLGNAYASLPSGDRDANLRRAIDCYDAALRVRTEADFPQAWAMTQNNLGNAHADLPSGDRDANLRRAIGCFDAALRVYTEADFPQAWATTQNNRGVTYADLASGDRDANLRRAIGCYDAALRVRTEADFPQDWAATQNNLGTAYAGLPSGDRYANLRRAIGCYDAALRVRTEADFPQAWAATQNNLGNAYANLPSGDRDTNLRRAIDCYDAALRVYTEADFPRQWTMIQNNRDQASAELRSRGSS